MHQIQYMRFKTPSPSIEDPTPWCRRNELKFQPTTRLNLGSYPSQRILEIIVILGKWPPNEITLFLIEHFWISLGNLQLFLKVHPFPGIVLITKETYHFLMNFLLRWDVSSLPILQIPNRIVLSPFLCKIIVKFCIFVSTYNLSRKFLATIPPIGFVFFFCAL